MLSGKDIVAAVAIYAFIAFLALIISLATGCVAYSTMPDKAQIRAINTFRESVGLDTISAKDIK